VLQENNPNLISMAKYIFCSSVFLVFTFLTPGFADEHFPFLAEVSKESVNVRSGPNTNFEKVDKLSRGAQVVVLGKTYDGIRCSLCPPQKNLSVPITWACLKGTQAWS